MNVLRVGNHIMFEMGRPDVFRFMTGMTITLDLEYMPAGPGHESWYVTELDIPRRTLLARHATNAAAARGFWRRLAAIVGDALVRWGRP